MIPDWLDRIYEFVLPEVRDREIQARVWAEKRARMREMAKDPVRRKYIERLERGEYWSDEQIAFNEIEVAASVCEHLLPIEQKMRDQKIDLRYLFGMRINANCLVDPEKLGIPRAPADGVMYVDVLIPDRSMLDPRSAWIACSVCDSVINVVHADSATPSTPWFPR